MKLTKIAFFTALTVLSQSSFALHDPQLKIDEYVKQQFTHNNTPETVLVVLREQADLTGADAFKTRDEKLHYVYDQLRTTALRSQGPLTSFLKARGVQFRPFYIENMIAIEKPSANLIESLATRYDVGRIRGNPIVRLKLPVQDNTMSNRMTLVGDHKIEDSLIRIGVPQVWQTFNVQGQDIVVASQDTGVEWDHPALKSQYRGVSNNGVNHEYNWHDAIRKPLNKNTHNRCGYDTQKPCDDYGHGTHTVGTMVGDDARGNQIGVAPKAKWVGCRNMDNGLGSPASYLECFEYFLAPYPYHADPMKDGDPSKAPHIINNSWGCLKSEGCYGDEILPALQAMKKAGIYVVVSAGNDGPSCRTISDPPAWHTGLSLTVGAFNHRNDQIAFFSSRGPSSLDGGIGPNISAPGVSIRSSVINKGYATFSGTSMAAPHTAGVVALLWSANKNLIGNIETTTKLIQDNSEPKTSSQQCGNRSGSEIPNNTFGHGLINAYRILSAKR